MPSAANANSVMLLPEGSQVPGGVERLLVAPASDQGNMAFMQTYLTLSIADVHMVQTIF